MNTKFFLDSANLEALDNWKWLVEGVTTNQKIFAKEDIKNLDAIYKRVEEIKTTEGIYHVSVQLPLEYNGSKKDYEMIKTVMDISDVVVLKLPPIPQSVPYIEYAHQIGRDDCEIRDVNITMITEPYQLLFLNHPSLQPHDFFSIFYNRAARKDEYDYMKREIHNIEWHELFSMMDKKMNLIVGSIRNISNIVDAYRQLWFLDQEDIVIFTFSPKVLEEIYAEDKVLTMLDEFDEALK